MLPTSDNCKFLCDDAVYHKTTARQSCVQRAYWDKWGKASLDPAVACNATSAAAGIAAAIRYVAEAERLGRADIAEACHQVPRPGNG